MDPMDRELKCSEIKDFVIVPLEVLQNWQAMEREPFLLELNRYIHDGERI